MIWYQAKSQEWKGWPRRNSGFEHEVLCINTYLELGRTVNEFYYIQSASIKLSDPKTDIVKGETDS